MLLGRLHQESSEANLSVCLFAAACLHSEKNPGTQQIQQHTQNPIKNRKNKPNLKENSALSFAAELSLHHMADQGDNLPLCSGV